MQLSGSLEQWENRIIAACAEEYQQVFGDNPTEIAEDDPRFEPVMQFVEKQVEEFPRAKNGSCYVGSYCVITPKLRFSQDDVKGRIKGDLVPYVDKLQVTFKPLKHIDFGTVTTEETKLTFKNLRHITGDPIRSNEFTEESIRKINQLCHSIFLKKDDTIGYVSNLSRELKMTKAIADIYFGKQRLPIHDIEVEVEGSTITYVVSLEPLNKAKISENGLVSLDNGSTFDIGKYLSPDPQIFIDRIIEIEAPFTNK